MADTVPHWVRDRTPVKWTRYASRQVEMPRVTLRHVTSRQHSLNPLEKGGWLLVIYRLKLKGDPDDVARAW